MRRKDVHGVALIAALAVLYVALASGIVSARTSQVISNHSMTLFPWLAGAFSLLAARRHQGRARTGWILLGAWGLLSGTGNFVWEYYEFVLHTPVPFPSLADAGYLSGNLCAVAAVAAFGVSITRSSRARSVLDASLIAGSVFLVSWTLVLGSLYRESGGSFYLQAVGLSYPVLDVIIVSLVVFVASGASAQTRVPLALIGLSMLGWAFSDTSFAYLTLIGTYRSGHAFDAGWIGGDALLALTALGAALSRTSAPETVTKRAVLAWRVSLPYIVAGVALVVGVGAQVTRGAIDPFILIGLMALFVVVVARQFVTVIEQQRSTIESMRALDDTKNSILRAVSHELRTPLTFINGAAQMLSDTRLSADDRHEVIDGLVRNGRRLEDFLTGLLDLERLTRGVLEPVRRPTDLTTLLSRVADAVHTTSHPMTVAGSSTSAEVDAALVERIVENLLINATRHTPAGTHVTASAVRTPEGVVLTVADDGPGVSDSMKEAIFRPFTQIDDDAGRGTGIGLALVTKFAELHGGRAWVEDAENGGARFRVLLADPQTSDAAA